VCSPDGLQKVFDKLPDDDTKRAVYFLLATGCRVGAMIALRADHVTVTGKLEFREGVKGNWTYRRDMPELPYRLPTHGLLFTRDGARWAESVLLRRVQRACIKAGVPEITLHTLRHAFCTYQLAAGVPSAQVMWLGGWRGLQMVDRYLDKSNEYRALLDGKRKGGYLPHYCAGMCEK